MKKILAVFLFLFCLNDLLFAQNDVDSLDQELEGLYQQFDLPGFGVAIVSAEKILYQKGFGYADKSRQTPYTPHTIQNIGSVSKTFIGVALVKAAEQGLLTLDAEINDFLPFEVRHPSFPEVPITIRHLATHTSGIQDTRHYIKSYVLENRNLPSKEEIDKDLYKYLKRINQHEKMPLGTFLKALLSKEGKWYSKKNFTKKTPGTTNEYSNIGASLAAYIIEIASGESFASFTQKHILSPLHMEASGWAFSQVDMNRHATLYFANGLTVPRYSLITYPDGGLLASISDLSKYLMHMIKGTTGKSNIFSPASFRALMPGDEDESRAFWGMGKSGNIGHSGSDPGVTTMLSFNSKTKTGYILFTNVDADENEILLRQFSTVGKTLKAYLSLLDR